jgi:glutamine synthetase
VPFLSTVIYYVTPSQFLVTNIVSVNSFPVTLPHNTGENEAPPAIVSIYIGDTLSEVVEEIVRGPKPESLHKSHTMKWGVNCLPDFKKDNSDRNRTSPFAFCGNKFEFR